MSKRFRLYRYEEIIFDIALACLPVEWKTILNAQMTLLKKVVRNSNKQDIHFIPRKAIYPSKYSLPYDPKIYSGIPLIAMELSDGKKSFRVYIETFYGKISSMTFNMVPPFLSDKSQYTLIKYDIYSSLNAATYEQLYILDDSEEISLEVKKLLGKQPVIIILPPLKRVLN